MNWTLDDPISLVFAALAGASGISLIYAFWVRPRVHYETRDLATVQVFREKHRAQIEGALGSLGVPTAYVEVAWWNLGYRAARQITVDVVTPSPIIVWEIVPVADDVAAGWTCALDPALDTADHDRLRIEQARLMPGGGCHLVVGYNYQSGKGAPKVRAFLFDRRIPNAFERRERVNILAGLIGFSTLILGMVLASKLVPFSSRIQLKEMLAIILVAALSNAVIILVSRAGPGKPPSFSGE
jgi:hypothetical protein